MEPDKQLYVFPPQAQVPAQPSNYLDQEGQSDSVIRSYLQILRKRKWWVLGFFLTTVIATWLLDAYSIPIYQATAVLRVTQENPSSVVGIQSAAFPYYRDEDRTMETQFNIMRSRALAKRVIKVLNLDKHPDFVGEEGNKEPTKKISPEEAETNLVDSFLGSLNTDIVRKTDLIRISYNSPDPDLAQKVANAMAEEYTQFEIDIKNQSFSQIKVWLEKQLVQLGQKVEGSQKKLYEYGEAGEILSPEDKDNVVIQKYVELNALLTKASSERIAKEAQYRQIKEKGIAASPITNNALVMDLRNKIAVDSAKVASLQKIYLPDHPKLAAEQANLQGLQSRLNSEIQNIRATVETDYEAARRTENLLLEALGSQKRKVSDLQKKLVQYKILKRDVETNEELYKGLLSRMKEAAVSSTMVASNVSVIDPAEKPLYPFLPKKTKNLAIAIIIGLMGGVFLALVVEHFDDSIKTAKEAEYICQLPILGLVPLSRRNKELPSGNREPGLISYNDQRSAISDAVFVVRTSVLLSVPGSPPAVIMVTSPNPLEGKTTMSTNLAISLAMGGRKVVLIDADMRRPSVHRSFDFPSSPGLSDVLTGSAASQDVLRPTEVPNLYVITAGPTPPNPATLLGSVAFKDLMGYLRDEFQHIIIDTPPTVSLPDSRVMSPMVDSAILVLRHNYTPRETARIARQVLSQVHAKLIGIVLNQVSYEKGGYAGYYYKKYHYHYYSDS